MTSARKYLCTVLWTTFCLGGMTASLFAASTPRFLYVTDVSGNVVVGFVVNPTTGALSPNGQAPVATGTRPLKAASDKGGFRLYVSNNNSFNSGSNSVSAYFINRTNGHISPVPGTPFKVSRHPWGIAVHPSGKFVYVALSNNAAGDGVEAFLVNSNGSLSPIAGSPFSTKNDPQNVLIDATGHYLYAADAASGFIDAFAINQTDGALTPLPGSPDKITFPSSCISGALPQDISRNPFNNHLYTADAFDNHISGYNISSTTGTLTQITGSPFNDFGCNNNTAFNPISVTIDGTGKFLYAANSEADNIAIYSILSNGGLKLLKFTANTFGGFCAADVIRTDPSGRFVYTLGMAKTGCTGGDAVVGYGVNSTTGNLTPITGSPWPNQHANGWIVVTP
ncbi:MAG TPA: beta-propeller fold lactonase family protein [Terriglobales bacterium]